jgi:D-alanyl-D-alanine endopeptidase (penicillin-binding protein 7)
MTRLLRAKCLFRAERFSRAKCLLRVSPLVLLGLVVVGAGPAAAASKTTTTTATKKKSSQASAKRVVPAAPTSSSSATPKRTLYAPERSLTRKATLARTRVNAAAREMAEVLPRQKVDANGEMVPDLRAAAAIIYDPETNEVLWEENSQDQRSIASITKVMTATVFFENNPDTSQEVTIDRSDVLRASTTYLRLNDRVTIDDLLHLLLIASDNAAARALARVSQQGSDGFVARMNEKALELGLQSTSYADPAGLLWDNVSSAYDMARLITHASSDERIASIMRMQAYTVYTGNRRVLTFHSTNHLLGRDDVDVRAGKTGFISRSGYCLATLLRLPESNHNVAVVVLGARSNAGRFMETRNLFTWLSAQAPTLFATKTVIPPAQ